MFMERIVKSIAALVAVGGFAWGIWSYFDQQEQAKETRRIEATMPFLQLQLSLYTEATRLTAFIATVGEDTDTASERERFWQLYWGELALVEDIKVEAAMKRYGQCLGDDCPKNELQRLAIGLAHACRDSLSESWGVSAWQSHWSRPRNP
jgi:hypothetical protein